MYQDEYEPEEWDEMVERFADPGGDSALWPATAEHPRVYPCPQCGEPNRLTDRDVASGYCCDQCANMNEGLAPQW